MKLGCVWRKWNSFRGADSEETFRVICIEHVFDIVASENYELNLIKSELSPSYTNTMKSGAAINCLKWMEWMKIHYYYYASINPNWT